MAKAPTPTGPKTTDEVRKVAELRADPKNAKRHSEQQIAQIASSIERFSYVNKVAIRPDGQIIAGHATLEAYKRLGHDTVEVRVVTGLSEAGYKALGIALNRLPENSSWDNAILAEIVDEIDEAGEDLQGLGFSDNEIKRLQEGDDPIEVKEIATGDVDDEFWISVRGPLKDQAQVFKALEAALKPFAGVTVDEGTIAVEQ
jgi:ParB-like chromosome segregation protein Spo0J